MYTDYIVVIGHIVIHAVVNRNTVVYPKPRRSHDQLGSIQQCSYILSWHIIFYNCYSDHQICQNNPFWVGARSRLSSRHCKWGVHAETSCFFGALMHPLSLYKDAISSVIVFILTTYYAKVKVHVTANSMETIHIAYSLLESVTTFM